MAWFIFLLIGVACVIYVFIWDYRKKTAKWQAASEERFERIFNAKPGAVPVNAVSTAAAPVAATAAPAALVVPPPFTPLARFLDPPKTLVYLLLRTAMPDYPVFGNVTLASVVGVTGSGFDREQQLRRLSACRLDFVVCDREMHIVAVVDLDLPGAGDESGLERFKLDSLKAAGLRRVVVNPKSLPSRDALRASVRGEAGGVGLKKPAG